MQRWFKLLKGILDEPEMKIEARRSHLLYGIVAECVADVITYSNDNVKDFLREQTDISSKDLGRWSKEVPVFLAVKTLLEIVVALNLKVKTPITWARQVFDPDVWGPDHAESWTLFGERLGSFEDGLSRAIDLLLDETSVCIQDSLEVCMVLDAPSVADIRALLGCRGAKVNAQGDFARGRDEGPMAVSSPSNRSASEPAGMEEHVQYSDDIEGGWDNCCAGEHDPNDFTYKPPHRDTQNKTIVLHTTKTRHQSPRFAVTPKPVVALDNTESESGGTVTQPSVHGRAWGDLAVEARSTSKFLNVLPDLYI
ncbi:hypothetical protein NCC49_006593 [Naganishia albida]|nr:hypothetical protein NCC49_006593 [Naganishia albida]